MPPAEIMTRILLVVADYLVSEEVSQVVRSLGYETWTCGSVEEALDLARDWSPDTVVVDYRLPGMNGIELAIKLRHECRTRVVLMSRGREAIGRAEKLGIPFLNRPFGVQELKRVLRPGEGATT